MPKKGSGYQNQMTPAESAIIEAWIESRAANGTTERTQAKHRHISYKIVDALHQGGKTLDKAEGKDFSKAAAAISKTVTQNSRQTIISQLKSMVKFIQKDRVVKDADNIIVDVKAGSPSKQNKNILSIDEMAVILNAPMSAKERAYLAMLYDGYHRPYEPYTLKWHDLKINSSGAIEYTITFKTGVERTIVQKPDTTSILELWRRESGHSYKDDAYIFPDNHGRQYTTLMQSTRLMARLEKLAGLHDLKPSSIRNTAITHDVQAGLPLTYICMRAWGEPYNDMINIYVKANSGQMQTDQHTKNGQTPTPIIEKPVKVLHSCPSCGKVDVLASDFCPFCGTNMDGKVPGVIKEQAATIAEMLEQMRIMSETLALINAERKALLTKDERELEENMIKYGGEVARDLG